MASVDQRTIEYVIKAKDQSSAVFENFSSKLTAALSVAALAKFTKDALFAADALEGVENRARAVFGSAMPRLTAETDKLAESLKRSSSDLLQMQADFGGVLQGSGLAGRGVADMTTKLSKLSVEFGNFFRIADDEAFNLIQGALIGQTRGLQRYGIVMNDVTMNEYLHAQGIKKKMSELSQAEQTLQRYNFLMDKTKKVQEAGAAATDSFGSKVKTLKGTWTDFQEVLGKGIAPAFIEGMNIAIQLATNLINVLNAGGFAIKGIGLGLRGMKVGELDALTAGSQLHVQNQAMLNAAIERRRTTGSGKITPDMDPYLTLGGGGGIGEGSDKAADKVKEMKEKITNDLESLREEYKETRDDVSKALVDLEIEHEDKMKDIDDSIKRVTDSINKLKDDYKSAIGEMTDSKFDSIVEQQEKVKKMQDELRRSTINPGGLGLDQIKNLVNSLSNPLEGVTGDDIQWLHITDGAEKQVELYLQLQNEQEALNKFLSANKDILSSPEFKEAQERSNMTGFEKDMAEVQKRIDERNAEHEAELGRLEEEKTKLEESRAKEIELYETRKQALNDTITELDNFRGKWQDNMQNIDKTTETIVNNLKKKLEELRNVISSIDALMQKRADVTGGATLTAQVRNRYGGGTVRNGEWTIVGEDGPELAQFPAGTKISSATQTKKEMGGSNGNITVNGPLIGSVSVKNEADVDMLMRELARKLELIPQSSS